MYDLSADREEAFEDLPRARRPVALPDYYEKIRMPIDLSTMIKKLKEGKYKFAVEVRDDLDLMMANCKQFNIHIETIRIAEKFESSIKT